MGSEHVEELPDELESWVDDRAAAEGITRGDVLRRLLEAHRLLEAADEAPDVDSETDSDSVPSEDALADVEDRVTALEAALDEKITDVRERVIQVKRETDAKAPAEHDHPEIERRLTEGFENYEEVLEYLTTVTDEHESKLDRIAGAVVDLRSRVSALERSVEERAAAADLRREANRAGVVEAVCESCGESVHLGLLDEPFCPHCESPFDGIDPKRGFFDSNRLTVGNRPALEAAEEPDRAADPAVDDTDVSEASTSSDASTAESSSEPSKPDDADVGAGIESEVNRE